MLNLTYRLLLLSSFGLSATACISSGVVPPSDADLETTSTDAAFESQPVEDTESDAPEVPVVDTTEGNLDDGSTTMGANGEIGDAFEDDSYEDEPAAPAPAPVVRKSAKQKATPVVKKAAKKKSGKAKR